MIRSIVVFILFLNGFSSISQTYYPFPKDSATWSDVWYAYYINPPFTPSLRCETQHYGLNGDTTIDNKLYSKLYINKSRSDTFFNYNNSRYHKGIREDSARKVWIREPSDSLDRLLYDFGLNKGDTFFYWTGVMEVFDIDSMLIDGSYRRTTLFLSFNPDTIKMIEGIGFKSGLFGPTGGTDGGEFMKCFTQNLQLIYSSSITSWFECKCIGCNCVSSPVGIDTHVRKDKSLKIFPNPVVDLLSISFDNQDNLSSKVEIYSVSGLRLMSTNIDNDNSIIDVRQLNQGMYILRIENVQNNYSGYFLKTMP